MSITDTLQTPTSQANQMPAGLNGSAVQTSADLNGVLANIPPGKPAPSASAEEKSVASTMASVSNTVGEQIEVARITADLRRKLVPLVLEFSFSTGISGAEKVGEFAQMVDDLNRIRKASLAEA